MYPAPAARMPRSRGPASWLRLPGRFAVVHIELEIRDWKAASFHELAKQCRGFRHAFHRIGVVDPIGDAQGGPSLCFRFKVQLCAFTGEELHNLVRSAQSSAVQ